MAKKSKKKQRAQSEKDNAGCMSGLISIFDFRQGRSTQRQLSDRRHGSARHGGDAGGGYSKGKLNLLSSSEDKARRSNDVHNVEGMVDVGTSVKVLMEEEMSRVQMLRKTSKIDAEQTIPLEVVYEKNRRKTSETSVLCCDLSPDDKSSVVTDKSNNLNKTRKFSCNPHLAALLEEICGDRHQCQRLLMDLKSILDSSPSHEKADKVLCDFHPQSGVQVAQDHSTIHKILIEIAETLINQDVKALCETSHHSEDLVNALDILNSKEVLLRLLQDPCSILVKPILETKTGQEGKLSQPESCNLLEESNVSSRLCEEPTNHKILQQKGVHKFFQKKDKLQEEKVPNGNTNAQPLSKIVVLKPTPPRSQNSTISISPSTSQSCDGLRTEAEKGRVASQFSLKEIKRRLRHVIGDNGKGQHILSMDGILHRVPYKSQKSIISDSKLKDGGQGKSASKTSDHKEHASHLSSSSKGENKRLKLKESQSSVMHEAVLQEKNLSIATATAPHKEYKFQREARKHLAEMFNIVDNEASFPAMKTSKPLGRMLSLSEYKFLSPMISPGREKESSLSPQQMRFSPLWQLKQENGRHASPTRESIEDSSCSRTCRTLDQSSDSNPDCQGQENTSGEISKQENLSNGEISGCTMVVEPPDAEYVQERNIVDMPSELNVDGLTSAVQRSEEKQHPLSPRANSSETSQTVDVFVPSTPIILLVPNVGSPDSITEKPERPSPVSVLEPLFTEDTSSPVDCTDGRVDFQGQQPHIHFEEHEDSAIVLTTSYHEDNRRTCLEEKECRFEYVRAVLEASGLIPGLLSDRWHSSPLLDPSLYDEVEYSSDEFPDDLKQLFDSINEVLEVLHQKFFSCTPYISSTKPRVQPLPSGENLIKEVWKGVDQYFSFQSPHTLDQIVGKDMEVGPWMDLRSGIESVDIDIGNVILDDIVEETLLGFCD